MRLSELLVVFISIAGVAYGQGILPAESSLSLDPLITLVGCLRESKPGYCLQRRALGFFESWLTQQGDDDEADELASPSNENGSEKLPNGLSPYWTKMVDSVAERISKMYGEEDDDEDEDEEHKKNKQDDETARNQIHEVEDERGHHKKKKKLKAIKKAIIKLVLIALLIKHKFKMLLTAFQTFLQFKVAFLATIYVVIHAIKLYVEIKHKHHPQKVIYYENAHHQHHYDDHHHEHEHDDHHHSPSWSLWGRSGLEATTMPPPFYPGIGAYFSKRSSDLPYSAYAPVRSTNPPANV